MHPRWKVLTAAITVSIAGSPSRAFADDCAGKTDAATCYIAAAQAVRDTQPGQAARFYLASYRIDPKIDPLAGYGLSLAADKQYVEAAEVLERAVEEYDKLGAQFQQNNADASTTFAVLHRIKLVREELGRLGSNIGWVQIKAPGDKLPVGITVARKDAGDLRSSNPLRIVVRAKGDTLVVGYPSGKTHEFPVNVAGGALTAFQIPPEPVEQPPKRDEEPPPPPPFDEHKALRQRAYIAAGAGTVLFAGGIIYTLASDEPSVALSAVMIGPGLIGLGLGVWWWVESDTKPTTPATVLAPMVGKDMIGLSFAGSL